KQSIQPVITGSNPPWFHPVFSVTPIRFKYLLTSTKKGVGEYAFFCLRLQYLFRPGTVLKVISVTGIAEGLVPGQAAPAEGKLLLGFKPVPLRICQLHITAHNQGSFVPDLNLDIRHEHPPRV